MNTLLNGSLHEEDAKSSCAGVAPDILPEAIGTQKGVSVRYVPSPNNRWYVLRASYNREVKALDILLDMGVYAYVVQHYTVKVVAGQQKRVLTSLLPNLLFAYMPENKAERYVKGLKPYSRDINEANDVSTKDFSNKEESNIMLLSTIVSFYYDHFKTERYDAYRNPPLTVNESEMISFIKATYTKSEHLKAVDEEKANLLKSNKNKMVEVIDGAYKGVKGRLARIAGQTCVVVPVANGKWNISTEYIPHAFLRFLE